MANLLRKEVQKILKVERKSKYRNISLERLQRMIVDLEKRGLLQEKLPSFRTLDDVSRENYSKFMRQK